MSVAVSSAFAPSGAHPIGVSSVPDRLPVKACSEEIYLVRHSNRHRWYYSAMNLNEVLVFKQYDSLINSVSRFTPHVAFDHPDATEAAPLRESIEVRCLAIFD